MLKSALFVLKNRKNRLAPLMLSALGIDPRLSH